MEIIIGISLGLVISFLCVFFYALGAKHATMVKNGSTIKLEPVKAITKKIDSTSKEKKEQKEQNQFMSDFAKIMNYNGERPKVIK